MYFMITGTKKIIIAPLIVKACFGGRFGLSMWGRMKNEVGTFMNRLSA